MPLEPVVRDEVIEQIALDCIVASPLNARSSANTERLGELADSMRTSGLHQPIVVRRRSAGSDMPYELVFGHRRTLAARSLGWVTIPAIVRDMNDQQVVLAQAVENLQREDLSPMDEARGYRQLLDELRLPVDDVVPLVGRSRTQIYARLKLLELGPDAAAAVHEGRLAAEIGQLLARQPRQLQDELLEDLLEGSYDGSPFSYRVAKQMLARHHKSLRTATFDLAEAVYHLDLVGGRPGPDIRQVSCLACQYRSGNQPDFDAANEEPNICLDTVCFEQKTLAHAARAKKFLAEKGAKESKLGQWEARNKVRTGELIDLDKKDPTIDKKRTLREVLGDQLAGAQIVDLDSGPSAVMTPRALETALKKAGVEKASSLVTKAETKKETKGESKWDRKTRLGKDFEAKAAAAIVPLVLAQGPQPGDLADVVKVVAQTIGNAAEVLGLMGVKVAKSGWQSQGDEDKAIEGLDDAQLAKFLVLLVVLSGLNSIYPEGDDEQTKAICARYGVDLAAIRAEVYGEEQPKKKGKK